MTHHYHSTDLAMCLVSVSSLKLLHSNMLFSLTIFGAMDRFLEGDFESYVRKMRKPHAWGGEPELLMCSHVLR